MVVEAADALGTAPAISAVPAIEKSNRLGNFGFFHIMISIVRIVIQRTHTIFPDMS